MTQFVHQPFAYETNILGQWKELTFESSITARADGLKDEAFSFEDFFKQKLSDGHGVKTQVEQLSDLVSFLQANPENRNAILKDVTEKIKESLEKIKTEVGEEKKKLGQMLKMNQVQKLCMEFVLESSASKEEQIKKIESISSQLSTLELDNDLKGLASSIRSPQKSSSKENVELCTGWEDLFLAGTEVAGSCQRVDEDARYNQCLLAYCLDGKNAMVAVKGDDGKLLARSMLRLLWDKGESKPTLFLDRLYPNPCPKEREEAIKMAAIECAKKLGLELYTDWSSGSSAQGKIIESLGSSCPYEYVDGAEEVMPSGVFTIRYARKID